MKFITAFICSIIFTFSLFAQNADEILATANGQNYTLNNLDPSVRVSVARLTGAIADNRKSLLKQQIADNLLEAEAAARKTTVEKLIETEIINKIPDPAQKEIQAVYDANQNAFEGKSLTESRSQIVAFLKQEPEEKALTDYIAQLKTRYKVAPGKDVNTSNLKPNDVLATIGGKTITLADFETKNKSALYDYEADAKDRIRQLVEETVYWALAETEAKAQNLRSSGELIAREVTDKMRDYTPDERERLESALKKLLFEKYKAKILVKEPTPFTQNISTDDDPSRGKADAPVTIVMFSDFQCPACGATHPVLEKVLAEYADKVRFVVRDFPLTTIHKYAFRAAVAANAANAQGKFFEYTDLLYKNQDKLDDESLKKYALEAGLNLKQFELDLASEKFAEEVRKDVADGKKYGVNATPTIFVNGVKVRTLSAEAFRRTIEQALKK